MPFVAEQRLGEGRGVGTNKSPVSTNKALIPKSVLIRLLKEMPGVTAETVRLL